MEKPDRLSDWVVIGILTLVSGVVLIVLPLIGVGMK